VEFAHIKPVSSFNKETVTLKEINDKTNILILCPTHHAEFDKGFISLEEIPNR
jgi:predicted restriction endonuclease